VEKTPFPTKFPISHLSPSFYHHLFTLCYVCSAEIFIISPFRPPLWGSQLEQGNQQWELSKEQQFHLLPAIFWQKLIEHAWEETSLLPEMLVIINFCSNYPSSQQLKIQQFILFLGTAEIKILHF